MKLHSRIGRSVGIAVLTFVTTISFAASYSLVGSWQTRDKRTKEPSSVIKIWKSEGKYFGKVVKIYAVNGNKVTDICVKCRGELRNKPILGLPIIKNMVSKGNKFVGGRILDPRNGKDYHCIFTFSPDGSKLNVRGYVGMPLFGRTDVWERTKA